jgi:hypothetical protein
VGNLPDKVGYFNYAPGNLPQVKVFSPSGGKSITHHQQTNNLLSVNYYQKIISHQRETPLLPVNNLLSTKSNLYKKIVCAKKFLCTKLVCAKSSFVQSSFV